MRVTSPTCFGKAVQEEDQLALARFAGIARHQRLEVKRPEDRVPDRERHGLDQLSPRTCRCLRDAEAHTGARGPRDHDRGGDCDH